MKRTGLLLFCIMLLTGSRIAHAQCDTNQMIDVGNSWYRVEYAMVLSKMPGDSNGTAPQSPMIAIKPYALWIFESNYAYENIAYTITDVRVAGSRLKLDRWCSGTSKESLSDSMLTELSRTEKFRAVEGDTISFYRDFGWSSRMYGPTLKALHRGEFIDYAVELVRSATGARVALIDTVGISGADSNEAIVAHGGSPLIGYVRYAIPPSLNGTDLYLRVRPLHQGRGLLERYDVIQPEYPKQNEDDKTKGWIDRTGGGLVPQRISLQELRRLDSARGGDMIVATVPSRSSTMVTVTTSTGKKEAARTLAEYDRDGGLLFISAIWNPTNGATTPVTSHYTHQGKDEFYVVSLEGDRVLAAERVSTKAKR